MLKVVIFLWIYVSVLINSGELNSVLNQAHINVRLRRGQLKLHRQYVNCLHVVI